MVHFDPPVVVVEEEQGSTTESEELSQIVELPKINEDGDSVDSGASTEFVWLDSVDSSCWVYPPLPMGLEGIEFCASFSDEYLLFAQGSSGFVADNDSSECEITIWD